MPFICFNGNFLPADQPLFTATNAGFKYGDGVFETMRFSKGQLLLVDLHFERLFSGLSLLQIDSSQISQQQLEKEIEELCDKNDCTIAARVRLAVYREGDSCGYIIEASPLSEVAYSWSNEGYVIDIFPTAHKAIDVFANLKSANYLPYVMADRFAKENGLDEAIVLNVNGAICDGSKTTIFLIQEEQIITPALNQGCVSGVMRRHFIQQLAASKTITETAVSIEDLQRADAVFLTNAIRGMAWVKSFRDKEYNAAPARQIYDLLF